MPFDTILASCSPERRLNARSHVDNLTVAAKAPRSGLKRPFSISESICPVSTTLRWKIRPRCHGVRQCLTQGLATLSEVLARSILRNLFQLRTLLGFSLQSFSPPQPPTGRFGPGLSLVRFPVKPFRPYSDASAISVDRRSCTPLCSPKV